MHMKANFRTRWRLAILAGAVAVAAGLTVAPPANATTDQHRVVVYYQTQYQADRYVSPKPLTDKKTGLTDLIVAAIHVNSTPGDIRLNDDVPSDPKFDPMWQELDEMKLKGVNVLGMLGGAAQGTFQRLEPETFGAYYPALKSMIAKYKLDGIDLDVEENMSIAGIRHLIDSLKADFGEGFIITMAPVATALSGGGNLSGFNYEELYSTHGHSISWFNTQFYCGWGNLASPEGYEAIINRGVFPASKVVAGTYTTTEGCSGYVPMDTLTKTIKSLTRTYPHFGGVASWEYFNSLPGGTSAPWKWAAHVSRAMKP
jgi:chitinase